MNETQNELAPVNDTVLLQDSTNEAARDAALLIYLDRMSLENGEVTSFGERFKMSDVDDASATDEAFEGTDITTDAYEAEETEHLANKS